MSPPTAATLVEHIRIEDALRHSVVGAGAQPLLEKQQLCVPSRTDPYSSVVIAFIPEEIPFWERVNHHAKVVAKVLVHKSNKVRSVRKGRARGGGRGRRSNGRHERGGGWVGLFPSAVMRSCGCGSGSDASASIAWLVGEACRGSASFHEEIVHTLRFETQPFEYFIGPTRLPC